MTLQLPFRQLRHIATACKLADGAERLQFSLYLSTPQSRAAQEAFPDPDPDWVPACTLKEVWKVFFVAYADCVWYFITKHLLYIFTLGSVGCENG